MCHFHCIQATWTVDILPDDLEENRERFKVMLKSPVNAVLGEYDQVRVIIKNAKNGELINQPINRCSNL